MTGLGTALEKINNEAVQAATREAARHQLIDGGMGTCTCSPDIRSCVGGVFDAHIASAVLAAAVPHIEAAIREKIAAEIEAETPILPHSPLSCPDCSRVAGGWRGAAAVARGGSR